MNIENPSYPKHLIKWFGDLPTISVEQLKNKAESLGESYHMSRVTIGPLEGLIVDITSIDSEKVVLLTDPGKKTRILKPSSIKTYYQDYDAGKKMFVATFDDKVWFYEEVLPNMPTQFAKTVNIGLDMTMPFLKQFPVKECDYIV